MLPFRKISLYKSDLLLILLLQNLFSFLFSFSVTSYVYYRSQFYIVPLKLKAPLAYFFLRELQKEL